MSLRLTLLFFLLLSAPISLVAADEGSLERDGVVLHYTTEGAGEPIVFLAGGPGLDVGYFRPAASYFPRGYRIIFLEQRGTGRSRFPGMSEENMTWKAMVEDLEALRVHLKLERLSLAGHSWGGMLAMAYASAYPSRVRLLVLIGSGGPTNEFWKTVDENMKKRVGAGGGNPYFHDSTKAKQLRSRGPHADSSKLILASLERGYDIREGLKRLTRPVLIVQGRQDPIGEKTAEEIHSLIRSSTLRYIEDCGHFPWIEKPESFQAILAGFLPAKEQEVPSVNP